jgi:hypothetical protein
MKPDNHNLIRISQQCARLELHEIDNINAIHLNVDQFIMKNSDAHNSRHRKLSPRFLT